MEEKKFKFEIDAQVKLITSGETGTIIGRAEYKESANSYYLHYKSADGRTIEEWWRESTLTECTAAQAPQQTRMITD